MFVILCVIVCAFVFVCSCACAATSCRFCSNGGLSNHELRHLSLHFGRCPSRLQLLRSPVPRVSPSIAGPWSKSVCGVRVQLRTPRGCECVPSQSSEPRCQQRRPRKSPRQVGGRVFRSWTTATRAAFFSHRAPPRRAKLTLGAVFEIGERAESDIDR